MDKLLEAVRNANSVMDSAATLIGGLRARVAQAQAEAQAAGANLPALDNMASDLDTHAQALAAATAENTSAAPSEQPDASTAPVVDPAAAVTE